MSPTIVIIGGLFILALVSGMVGLGVAFAALPFLGFLMPDLGQVTTLAAPLGSWAAQIIPQLIIWYLYFAAVLYLAYRLFKPAKPGCDHPRYSCRWSGRCRSPSCRVCWAWVRVSSCCPR